MKLFKPNKKSILVSIILWFCCILSGLLANKLILILNIADDISKSNTFGWFITSPVVVLFFLSIIDIFKNILKSFYIYLRIFVFVIWIYGSILNIMRIL